MTTELEDVKRLLREKHSELSPRTMPHAISQTKCEYISNLKLLLTRASRLVRGRGIDEPGRQLGKYSRLCLAILEHQESRVAQLIGAKDYPSYAGILDDQDRPACLAVRFGGPDVIKAFFSAGVDLRHVYWEAVREGNLELIRLCARTPGFDMRACDRWKRSALHEACSTNQLEVIRLLIGEHGLDLNARDSWGRTPLYDIKKPEVMWGALQAFPEADVNARTHHGYVLLHCKTSDCQMYAILLANGADPHRALQHDYCASGDRCDVLRYLQKTALVRPEYVKGIVQSVLGMDSESFRKIRCPDGPEYEAELERMRNLRINFSRTAGKSLLDFLLQEANEAARYARNEVILRIYREHAEDFSNLFPHYGFALNYQLRRSAVRRDRFESALALLCEALGSGVPEEFVELIFGSFSNGTLKRFSSNQ